VKLHENGSNQKPIFRLDAETLAEIKGCLQTYELFLKMINQEAVQGGETYSLLKLFTPLY
jgi:hypothetical protein